MKKGKKGDADKNKKKGWGARLMSLIAGSSDEDLAPSDDEQEEAPRGKGGGSGAAARIIPADPPSIDSRAALKKMLKDPDQKKVWPAVFSNFVLRSFSHDLPARKFMNSRNIWESM